MNPLYPVQISQLRAAAEIWANIETTKEPADRWLGNYFHRNRKKLGARDRRFLSETIYSLFRNKLLFKYWARKQGKEKDSEFLVRLAATYEGLIPNQNVLEKHADFEKADGFAMTPEEQLSLHYSYPLWLVRRWQKTFPEDLEKILASMNQRPPLVIRANVLKISREALLRRLEKKGCRVEATQRSSTGIRFKERMNLFDSEEFRSGLFEIQDEGSQILCERMSPVPGEILWDVCAGGGGKSLALAALMQNKGRILATDIRTQKLMDLKKRARRAAITNIFPAELDRISETQAMKKGADKILVDAPCSGTGTFRRNPDAKWKLREEDFDRFQSEQLKILEEALPYLKPGGVLYYATCSLEPEENEEVIEGFLERHPECRLETSLRLYPHREATDGFFMATLKKLESKNGEKS
ncbi:MAG: RsmB/NOP family class I SAM-dependent RNA methyltransferase [Candidatus Omnitrophica bacterium]|nr:RsmB/NOP family class I SAM-dependent RNA methyltransferase [Candidatus Omnitrophota bacterium]